MILEKMENDLFYNLRHLKTFKEMTDNSTNVWRIDWSDGGDPSIVSGKRVICNIPSHDIQLAEYMCALHNMSTMLIKEVESKYVS